MKNIFSLLLISIILVSCGTQDALNFNNKLVAIQNEVIREGTLLKAGGTQDIKKLEKAKEFVKTKIQEIKDLKGPSDAEAFRNAMVDDLQFVYNIYDLTVKMLDSKTPDDEKQKLAAQILKMDAEADKYDNKMLEEQRKFAKKYNIELR